MEDQAKYNQAIQLFDEYNKRDPEKSVSDGREVAKNLLYAQRMTAKLEEFDPNASEYLRLAAHCQHIGRWEIPRNSYPMDRKGYLQWRSQLKLHHARIASEILLKLGYDETTVSRVKDLLMKKQLKQNAETQTLEDVICLVFLEYYFDDFAKGHEEEKVISILRKTIAKMSEKGITAAMELSLPDRTKKLIGKAST